MNTIFSKMCSSKSAVDVVEEDINTCPICLDNKALIKLDCNHEYCVDCISYLCSDICTLKKQCPMCRVKLTNTEVDYYKSLNSKTFICTNEGLEAAIKRICSVDPTFNSVIQCLEDRVTNEELTTQVNAIDQMFQGKMSYAEMRMLAG